MEIGLSRYTTMESDQKLTSGNDLSHSAYGGRKFWSHFKTSQKEGATAPQQRVNTSPGSWCKPKKDLSKVNVKARVLCQRQV